MEHLRMSKTQKALLLDSLGCIESPESLPFARSPVMVQLRRCEFISVAAWEWMEELLLSPVTHPHWWARRFTLPSPPHLTAGSCSITRAVISCQVTGKKDLFTNLTDDLDASAAPVNRGEHKKVVRHQFLTDLIETFLQIWPSSRFTK